MVCGAQLSPESAEEYIEYLKSSDRLDEAAQRLATVVNDERFVSKAGKSNYQVGLGGDGGQVGGLTRSGTKAEIPSWTLQLWHELCDLISQNPDKVQSLNVDAIIRGGLTRFTDQLGKLWCSLADYYIRSGHFEKVRGYTGYRAESPTTCGHGVSRKHLQVWVCHRAHMCTSCHAYLAEGLQESARPGFSMAVWPWIP